MLYVTKQSRTSVYLLMFTFFVWHIILFTESLVIISCYSLKTQTLPRWFLPPYLKSDMRRTQVSARVSKIHGIHWAGKHNSVLGWTEALWLHLEMHRAALTPCQDIIWQKRQNHFLISQLFQGFKWFYSGFSSSGWRWPLDWKLGLVTEQNSWLLTPKGTNRR